MHNYRTLIANADILLNTQIEQGDKPIVAVWGLMNAGKSYLLNMLTNHVEQEYFKTNDIRETAEVKIYEDSDFIYMDTPGLDGSHADDLEAHRGVKEADIVLFVHQLQGALDRNEIEFLSMLKKRYGEYAESSIIIVLSKIDRESQNPEKIETIYQEIVRQCEEVIGFSPQCFAVSGVRYKKGIVDHQPAFVKASHVDSLRQHLLENSYNVVNIRQRKKCAEIAELIGEIASAGREYALEVHQLMTEIETQFAPFNEGMAQFSNWLSEKSAEITQLSRERRNI